MKKISIAAALILVIALVLTACGSSGQSPAPQGGSSEARTVKISFLSGGIPYGYVDEKGNATGYEIEVLKLADELIPEYDFEFVPTDATDARAGALEGKYQINVLNNFYTAERAENYIIPEQYIGASLAGFVVRSENADVDSFAKVYEQGLKIAPIEAVNAMNSLVRAYNEANPGKQIEVETSDGSLGGFGTSVGYLIEGRYDVATTVKASYLSVIKNETGDLHKYSDQLTFNPVASIKTYTLVNKNEADLAEKLDKALKQLKDEGKFEELSLKFNGENVFEFIDD